MTTKEKKLLIACFGRNYGIGLPRKPRGNKFGHYEYRQIETNRHSPDRPPDHRIFRDKAGYGWILEWINTTN